MSQSVRERISELAVLKTLGFTDRAVLGIVLAEAVLIMLMGGLLGLGIGWLLVQNLIDRCMQMHGAGGLSRDYFLAEAFNYARWCRQADGPDQVHLMALGKQIIERYGD